MKKLFIKVICFLLFSTCFAQTIEKWKDLYPFRYLTEEEWNSIVKNHGDELRSITVDCGNKNIGVWYLDEEPEYEHPVDFGKKRAVFLVQEEGRFVDAVSFVAEDDLTKDNLYSNPFNCGVQGYTRLYRLSLIEASKSTMINYMSVEPYVIFKGAYEWPSAASELAYYFYFWDEYEQRVICVDSYNDDVKSLYVPVKNPRFYYGSAPDDLEHNLYISSWDDKTNSPIPNRTWLLKDGKATKVID